MTRGFTTEGPVNAMNSTDYNKETPMATNVSMVDLPWHDGTKRIRPRMDRLRGGARLHSREV